MCLRHLIHNGHIHCSRCVKSQTSLFLSLVILFCSLAILDLRVGHTMDVFSSFISSVIMTDSSTESHVHVLMLSSRPCVVFLACVHLALFLALSLSPGNSLVSSWRYHSMLVSLLWQWWCNKHLSGLSCVFVPMMCFQLEYNRYNTRSCWFFLCCVITLRIPVTNIIWSLGIRPMNWCFRLL